MLRVIYRLMLALFILALLSTGSIWMVLRGSLPEYSGIVNVSALAEPVTIERDSLGSVTILARHRHDMI